MGFGKHSNSRRRAPYAPGGHNHHHHHHHRRGFGRGRWVGGWHSQGSQRYGRAGCSLIWSCLCIGPILLIVGIALIAIGNSADRDSSIRSYNDGIERWLHSGHYDLFAQVAGGAFQVSFQNPFPPLDVSLARSTREPFRLADTGRSSDSVKIQAYPDHELVHLGEAELDVSGMCRDTTGCNTDPALGRFVIKFNGAQANDYRMPLFTSTRSLAEYEADCCDGCWWDELRGWCYKYNILDGISLKVSATNVVPRTWNPDPAYGGPSAGESPDWGPGWYKPLRITRGNFPHTLRVPVVVRSLHDPRSNFYRIMGGGHSLDFGSDGSGQIVAGIVLLIIGCLILFALIAVVCRLTRCAKRAVVGDTYTSLENGGGAPDVVVVQQQAAPGYLPPVQGQPAMYPQQQQQQQQVFGGYAQPMPQPQPGMGYAPQVPYGQPQPGYVQPQQGYVQQPFM